MTPRERVLAALSHRDPVRVPRYSQFTPAILGRFRDETGAADPDDYFDHEVRDVALHPTKKTTDFRRYHPSAPKDMEINEWGVGHLPGTYYHFYDYAHPMTSFTSVREVEEYPWPDLDADYRYEGLRETVESWHRRGYAVRCNCGPVFEAAWALRGLQQMLIDLATGDDIAAAIIDRVERLCRIRARGMAEAGSDILLTSDDVGTQRGMMMKPDLWRRTLKPPLARVIQAAKEVKPDIHVFYHSDGNVEAIISELIEVGVDVLNPVQPECMDPMRLKQLYGDRLSFWGTIGTQTTMPRGTPQTVRETVIRMIETVGRDGGLILAPTHVIEPDVPWENVLAFYNAIDEHAGLRGYAG